MQKEYAYELKWRLGNYIILVYVKYGQLIKYRIILGYLKLGYWVWGNYDILFLLKYGET